MTSLRLLLLVTGAVLLLAPSQAFAWADGGHKTIALIAWSRLDGTERRWVMDTLRAHPMFDEHFAVPMRAELGPDAGDEAQQRWLVAQASVWPDMVRPPRGGNVNPNADHHRPLWHYADLPVFADEAARKALKEEDREPDMSWTPGTAGFREINFNIVQALKKAMHELPDRQVPAAERAVMLCWLFHLMGDIHQPCHCAALFMPNQLPTGDRGANGVSISGLPGRPLHAYWDNLLGEPGTSFASAEGQTSALLADSALLGGIEAATAVTAPEAWLREGWWVATESVYAAPLIEAIRQARPAVYSRDGQKFFSVTARLSDEARAGYEAGALRVARERVAVAGLRLAQAIKMAAAP